MDVEHNYWGWWPIITLVICAITVFGVFRAVLWIIRWSGTEPAGPVDLEATHKIVRPAAHQDHHT